MKLVRKYVVAVSLATFLVLASGAANAFPLFNQWP